MSFTDKPEFYNPDFTYSLDLYTEELIADADVLPFVTEMAQEWGIKVGFSYSTKQDDFVCSATRSPHHDKDKMRIATTHGGTMASAFRKMWFFLDYCGGKEDFDDAEEKLARLRAGVSAELVALKRARTSKTDA